VKALLIPVTGPLVEVDLDGTLGQLQALVGGNIEAVPLPEFIGGSERATAYVNEEGKFLPRDVDGEPGPGAPNMRATDFMVPGVGLFPNDYIAGAFLLCGFDAGTGEHADLPDPVLRRARLIEREAGH